MKYHIWHSHINNGIEMRRNQGVKEKSIIDLYSQISIQAGFALLIFFIVSPWQIAFAFSLASSHYST
jgi:hypothetical protein